MPSNELKRDTRNQSIQNTDPDNMNDICGNVEKHTPMMQQYEMRYLPGFGGINRETYT